MIIASNGMLTGGRVVGHLRTLIVDPSATLLLWATRARDAGRAFRRREEGQGEGQLVSVRCQVRSICGLLSPCR